MVVRTKARVILKIAVSALFGLVAHRVVVEFILGVTALAGVSSYAKSLIPEILANNWLVKVSLGVFIIDRPSSFFWGVIEEAGKLWAGSEGGGEGRWGTIEHRWTCMGFVMQNNILRMEILGFG